MLCPVCETTFRATGATWLGAFQPHFPDEYDDWDEERQDAWIEEHILPAVERLLGLGGD
jgi:hypothetical protein